MRTRLAMSLVLAALAVPAAAQQNAQPAATAPANANGANQNTPANTQPNAQVQAWEEHNRPGAKHLQLATRMSGTWQTTTTFWTAPDAAPQTSGGAARVSPVLNGRFVCQEIDSRFAGRPFKGLGYFGFNNGSNRFESFWIDNESTGMLTCTGSQSEDGSITWKGAFTDPISGQNKTAKSITRFPAKDHWVFEMYDTTSDGREFLSLKVDYNRTGHTPALELKPVEPANPVPPKDMKAPANKTGQKPANPATPAEEPAQPETSNEPK